MLISVALILFVGLLLGWICKKIQLPSLFGMILGGILIGPFVLNLIDGSVLAVSTDLRRIALIIILIRAGLKLTLSDLRKVGRPAVLMCFIPASFEIVGMVILAPKLLGISMLDAAIMGAVVGSVSTAVIVPRMIRLMDEDYGTDRGIVQMILASSSVDNVFVIVIFTNLVQEEAVSVISVVNIPASIILGSIVGILFGWLLSSFFSAVHIRDTIKVIILLILSFAFVSFEDAFPIPFAALIGVMAMGIELHRKKPELSSRLSVRFDKLWVVAELFLFVLVGASVSITSVTNSGLQCILLVLGVLIFRMLGVFICLLGTKLSFKERLFCMIAYTPKATVQAAIGGLPLALGLSCGEIVLTVSVIAILFTAPLGAFGIDLTYKKLLRK